VLAEWQLLRARILRTRLSLWLTLLAGGLGWLALSAGGGAVALEQLALRLGALSAVLCVAFGAGSDLDRAALRLTLTHPTTPTAVAAGRWLGATAIATIVTLAATAAVAGASPRRRILVVDDNVDAAEALGELLRDFGHEVATAHDGTRALDQARLHRPDIVLLDISMPEMDGYEVAKRIRGELGLGDALLVALTGYGEDRHRRLAREAGFDQHVTKPVDASKLEELLKLPL